MSKILVHVFGLSWIAFAIYGIILVWQNRYDLGIEHITFGMFVCFVMTAAFQAMVHKNKKES